MQVMGIFVTCHSSESLYFLYLTSLLFFPATSVYNFLPVSSLSSAFTSVWLSLDSAYEGKYGVLCFLLSLFALPHLFPFLPHHSLSYFISLYVLHMGSHTYKYVSIYDRKYGSCISEFDLCCLCYHFYFYIRFIMLMIISISFPEGAIFYLLYGWIKLHCVYEPYSHQINLLLILWIVSASLP